MHNDDYNNIKCFNVFFSPVVAVPFSLRLLSPSGCCSGFGLLCVCWLVAMDGIEPTEYSACFPWAHARAIRCGDSGHIK